MMSRIPSPGATLPVVASLASVYAIDSPTAEDQELEVALEEAMVPKEDELVSKVRKMQIEDDTVLKVMTNIDGKSNDWQGLENYLRQRSNLSVVKGLLFFKDRLVIPKALRFELLQKLHSAHQGVNSMLLRAGNSFWWPGIAEDVDRYKKTV